MKKTIVILLLLFLTTLASAETNFTLLGRNLGEQDNLTILENTIYNPNNQFRGILYINLNNTCYPEKDYYNNYLYPIGLNISYKIFCNITESENGSICIQDNNTDFESCYNVSLITNPSQPAEEDETPVLQTFLTKHG